MKNERYVQIIGELVDGDWSGYALANVEGLTTFKKLFALDWAHLIGLSNKKIVVTPHEGDKGQLDKVEFFLLDPDDTGFKWEYSDGTYNFGMLSKQNGEMTYEHVRSFESDEAPRGDLASNIIDLTADGYPALIEARASLEFGLHDGMISHVAIASQDLEVGYLFHATVHTPAPQA